MTLQEKEDNATHQRDGKNQEIVTDSCEDALPGAADVATAGHKTRSMLWDGAFCTGAARWQYVQTQDHIKPRQPRLRVSDTVIEGRLKLN